MPQKSASHSNLSKGNQGETIACKYLSGKGYGICAVNWRFGRIEVDIIARKENLLIFVEVKTRSSAYFCSPEYAVNKAKQKRIVAAANQYLKTRPTNGEIRFDVISILLLDGKTMIRHLKNAFYPLAR